MRRLALLFLLCAGAALAQPAPESAAGRTEKPLVRAGKHLVVAANSLAATAGREVLRAGGSAIDAAVAVQMVLGLVEPQSSGIGGGAFLLHWSAKERVIESWDGRETAPAAAQPERFIGADGKKLSFKQAVLSGASVGVPGALRALEAGHKAHGKLPWASLFAPAIALAEDGFPMSPRLHAQLAKEKDLKSDYFYQADGTPHPVGTPMVNTPYAQVLKRIAFDGPGVFYSGEIARDVVAAAASDMTLTDLAHYEAKHREAVCGAYRQWRVCGMAPPSSGAVAVLQILGALERFEMKQPGAEAVHLFSEAARLAYADRGKYLADADFAPVPVSGLLDRSYLRDRAGLIDRGKSMKKAEPGEPPRRGGWNLGADGTVELPGTSHVSIVDSDGNAVAMTTTIEDGFGSRRMVHGFLLNNQLTDFSFQPEEDGKPVANRVEGGKRPRSSMAPTMVFDTDGRLVAVVGSPGGSQIINYVAQTLVAMLDWNMDPQAAVSLAHFGSRNGPTELEVSAEADTLKMALEAKGHEVRVIDMTSGLHAIRVTPQGLEGGADPRREGIALGD